MLYVWIYYNYAVINLLLVEIVRTGVNVNGIT